MSPRAGCSRGKSAWVRALATSVLAAVSPLAPGSPSLQAQVSPEILQVLQQGGAWVALAIEDGVGSFQSGPVPTLGIQLRGQLRIWEEHTGNWHVVMRDLARAEDPVILERLMVPGEPWTSTTRRACWDRSRSTCAGARPATRRSGSGWERS